MNPQELNYISTDPGAVKYGNFINYYSFHSTKERISNLHRDMFQEVLSNKPIICLDIGCNTGELTKDLYIYLKTNIYPKNDIYMLGIDIDPMLIERAKELNENSNIVFLAADVMDRKTQADIDEYLKTYNRNTFNITFSFSVTMWIHINHGDMGLEIFLKFLKTVSDTIVLEPQPWNCYRNAQRRLKKSGSTFPLYETLKIRGNVEETIEKLISDNTHTKVYESSSSSWKRKIQCFCLKKNKPTY